MTEEEYLCLSLFDARLRFKGDGRTVYTPASSLKGQNQMTAMCHSPFRPRLFCYPGTELSHTWFKRQSTLQQIGVRSTMDRYAITTAYGTRTSYQFAYHAAKHSDLSDVIEPK